MVAFVSRIRLSVRLKVDRVFISRMARALIALMPSTRIKRAAFEYLASVLNLRILMMASNSSGVSSGLANEYSLRELGLDSSAIAACGADLRRGLEASFPIPVRLMRLRYRRQSRGRFQQRQRAVVCERDAH
jgi:hypothetical protein